MAYFFFNQNLAIYNTFIVFRYPIFWLLNLSYDNVKINNLN